MSGGKTDIRWSPEEWAALVGVAEAAGVSPGRAAKRIVVDHFFAPDERGIEPSRPGGSAGSVGPSVPPAGGGAPEAPAAVDSVPGSAAAPPALPVVSDKPMSLERAVARQLGRRFGSRQGLYAMARREIMRGKVVVDGEVCRDPARLVDPASLG